MQDKWKRKSGKLGGNDGKNNGRQIQNLTIGMVKKKGKEARNGGREM